jgi:biotin carboxyl carrier protein
VPQRVTPTATVGKTEAQKLEDVKKLADSGNTAAAAYLKANPTPAVATVTNPTNTAAAKAASTLGTTTPTTATSGTASKTTVKTPTGGTISMDNSYLTADRRKLLTDKGYSFL